jgi:hypothetical protein
MSDPPDLFSFMNGYGPGVRPTDPSTSHAAAARTPRLRNTDRYRCLMAHYANPEGLTDYQLADLVGRQQNSAGKRRGELCEDGYVEKTIVDGIEIKRKGPSGADCLVWRITALGRGIVELHLPERPTT